MTRPAVSIIMNCLNCARDLPEALESIRKQTFQDWEIIFWDNASTDESPAIAKAFGPKLRYFRAEKTAPLGRARNLALAQAQGEYLAFLDCDDLWKPEKLELQLQLFQNNPKVGLTCTDTEIFNGRKVVGTLFGRGRPGRGMAFRELMQRQWIGMSSAMLSRQALNSIAIPAGSTNWFDERLELCEEADVFYRIAHDWQLDYIDAPLTVWRVHGGNTTLREFDKFASETLMILDKHRKLYPDYDKKYGDMAAMLEKRAKFQQAVALWRNGHGPKAREFTEPFMKSDGKFRLFWLASFLPPSLFNFLAKCYFAMPGKN